MITIKNNLDIMIKTIFLLLAFLSVSLANAQNINQKIKSEMLFFGGNKSCQNNSLCSDIDLNALNKHIKLLCEELVRNNIKFVL